MLIFASLDCLDCGMVWPYESLWEQELTIAGVFFDLGGTLFDYEHAGSKTGLKLMESIATLAGGDRFKPEEIGRAYWQANRVISKSYAELDYYLHADMFRATYSEAVKQLELEFDEETYQTFSAYQHENIVKGLTLKEDCRSTLTALKDKGLYLSIVSNIDEDMLQPLVQRENLHDVMDHWTSSEAAESCKPHEKFFNVSLEKAELEAHQVMFVGDSPEHDVNGAGALGMRTVLIKNGELAAPLQSGADVRAPDHVIHSLSELIGIV
ncbi:MAG: HAD superfamily hydrolase (TIGR01509 family) [Limisphaerales bacterium]|jgi:HAD superfamily hydrolase (TIGR01509 family)